MLTHVPEREAGIFRLGTRGSPLALAQAHLVRDALMSAHGWHDVEVVPFRTSGDLLTAAPLADFGGKALWTRELDRALLDGRVDACVHSVKDVETLRPEHVALSATLPRADVRERLIGASSIAALSRGAIVGTSSPRRAAQLLYWRPDLRITAIRGNVATRLAKCGRGEVDATLLAAAGLDRLGHIDVGASVATDVLLPSAGQGAIGIETLSHGRAKGLVMAIDHRPTSTCVLAERALLAHLGAGCHSPVGALATIADGKITLRAELLSEDGCTRILGQITALPEANGPYDLASDLISRAPPTLLALFQQHQKTRSSLA